MKLLNLVQRLQVALPQDTLLQRFCWDRIDSIKHRDLPPSYRSGEEGSLARGEVVSQCQRTSHTHLTYLSRWRDTISTWEDGYFKTLIDTYMNWLEELYTIGKSTVLKSDSMLTRMDFITAEEELRSSISKLPDVELSTYGAYCPKCSDFHVSKSAHSLLRLRKQTMVKHMDFTSFPVDLERQVGFNLHKLFAPVAFEYIASLGLTRPLSPPDFVRAAKSISDFCKKYALWVENTHHFYAGELYNVESLGGFWSRSQVPDFDEDAKARELLQQDNRATHPLFPQFFEEWKKVVDELVPNWKYRPTLDEHNELMSFDDFVADYWLWATGGSSTYGHLHDIYEKKLRVSKSMAANIDTQRDLLKYIRTTMRIEISPVIKPETGKIRVAYQVDLANYLRCCYLLRGFFGPKHQPLDTPLGFKPKDMMGFYRKMSDACNNNSTTKVPFDFTMFEKQPTQEELEYLFNKLTSGIEPYAHRDFTKIKKEFLYAFKNGFYHNKHSKANPDPNGPPTLETRVHIDYMKGMVSGMYWTLDFDTFLNYSWHITVSRLCETQITSIRAQGDDTGLEHPTFDQAVKHLAAMSLYGFENNPHKFWLSNNRTEMLRCEYRGGEVRGYLCRQITSLMQRKPNGTDTKDLRSMCSNYGACVRRSFGQPNLDAIQHLLFGEIEASFGSAAVSHIKGNFVNGPLGVYPLQTDREELKRKLKSEGLVISAPPGTGKSTVALKYPEIFVDIDTVPEMLELYSRDDWSATKTKEDNFAVHQYITITAERYRTPDRIVLIPTSESDLEWFVPWKTFLRHVAARRRNFANAHVPFETWYSERKERKGRQFEGSFNELWSYLYDTPIPQDEKLKVENADRQLYEFDRPVCMLNTNYDYRLCRVLKNRGKKWIIDIGSAKLGRKVPGTVSFALATEFADKAKVTVRDWFHGSSAQILLHDRPIWGLPITRLNVQHPDSITVHDVTKYIVRQLRGDGQWRYTNLTWWGLDRRVSRVANSNEFVNEVSDKIIPGMKSAAIASIRAEEAAFRHYEVTDFDISYILCSFTPSLFLVNFGGHSSPLLGLASKLGFVSEFLKVWVSTKAVSQWGELKATYEVKKFVEVLKWYTSLVGKHIAIQVLWGDVSFPTPILSPLHPVALALFNRELNEILSSRVASWYRVGGDGDFLDVAVGVITRKRYLELLDGDLRKGHWLKYGLDLLKIRV